MRIMQLGDAHKILNPPPWPVGKGLEARGRKAILTQGGSHNILGGVTNGTVSVPQLKM